MNATLLQYELDSLQDVRELESQVLWQEIMRARAKDDLTDHALDEIHDRVLRMQGPIRKVDAETQTFRPSQTGEYPFRDVAFEHDSFFPRADANEVTHMHGIIHNRRYADVSSGAGDRRGSDDGTLHIRPDATVEELRSIIAAQSRRIAALERTLATRFDVSTAQSSCFNNDYTMSP
eukprot:GEMP01062539.1.p1 GENE.GEMP01062539.1~~GEMP01062539.1.p1  ORF type:complete len:177 (+),score=38.71 GEMP01062539.1:44-574(+)